MATCSSVHVSLQIRYAFKNDCTNDLCVTLASKPLYCVCDLYCFHGPTGAGHSRHPIYIYCPFALLNRESHQNWPSVAESSAGIATSCGVLFALLILVS